MHNETLSVRAALCHVERVQQTARDQELHGDLTWRGGYESAPCSSNRLSTPVECSQFVAKEFQQRIVHFATPKINAAGCKYFEKLVHCREPVLLWSIRAMIYLESDDS
jgi:hypothetical protein